MSLSREIRFISQVILNYGCSPIRTKQLTKISPLFAMVLPDMISHTHLGSYDIWYWASGNYPARTSHGAGVVSILNLIVSRETRTSLHV